MSVRVTERLIGDVVIASGIPNSPLMVVQAIDEEAKLVTTTWFSNSNECQEGLFPSSSLDRYEPSQPAKAQASKAKNVKAAAAKDKKAVPGRRGRKPAAK